jgi:hypothetical protein
MKALYLLLIILVPIIPFVGFWIIAYRREWQSIRLWASSITILIAGTTLLMWLGTQDSRILILGIVIALIHGLAILSAPITAPNIAKKLNLPW